MSKRYFYNIRDSFDLFKSEETVVGKKKAVEKKDLGVMRILVQHLSARRITDGMFRMKEELCGWMKQTQR